MLTPATAEEVPLRRGVAEPLVLLPDLPVAVEAAGVTPTLPTAAFAKVARPVPTEEDTRIVVLPVDGAVTEGPSPRDPLPAEAVVPAVLHVGPQKSLRLTARPPQAG